MALTINEQIASLEAQLILVKGRGSAAKKKSIQAKIDALRAENEPTPEEEPTPEATPEPTPEVEAPKVKKQEKPTVWEEVTMAQVKTAEAEHRLCGFDPDKMIALIKKA